jgi:hypothetical protein
MPAATVSRTRCPHLMPPGGGPQRELGYRAVSSQSSAGPKRERGGQPQLARFDNRRNGRVADEWIFLPNG